MLPAALLALTLGGCSLTKANTTTPTGGGGAAKAIGTVISNFSSDASSNNSSAICKSILATSLVKHLNSIGSCTTIIGNQINTVESFSMTVTKYGVAGNSATALVKSPYNGTNRLYTVKLVKQAGTWRISGLNPAK